SARHPTAIPASRRRVCLEQLQAYQARFRGFERPVKQWHPATARYHLRWWIRRMLSPSFIKAKFCHFTPYKPGRNARFQFLVEPLHRSSENHADEAKENHETCSHG